MECWHKGTHTLSVFHWSVQAEAAELGQNSNGTLIPSYLPSQNHLLIIYLFLQFLAFLWRCSLLLFLCGKLKDLWTVTCPGATVLRDGLILWFREVVRTWRITKFTLPLRNKRKEQLAQILTDFRAWLLSKRQQEGEESTWFYVIRQAAAWSGHCGICFRLQKKRF